MRGAPNDFLKTWANYTAATPAGELTYTVFPGPEPFVGCTRLDGVPIAPADAHRHLTEVDHEHAGLRFLGETPSVLPPAAATVPLSRHA